MLLPTIKIDEQYRVLFVTWDGPGLAYLESLFVPIFSLLKQHGFAFDVLQFRWGSDEEEARACDRCRSAGIGYRSVRVRRGAFGLGPMLTAVMGGREIHKAAKIFGSTVIMPRSTLPAIACLYGKTDLDRPVIFDADGLEVDERVEFGGLDARGLIYRFLRDGESQMVRRAASVLTRTPSATAILKARAGAGVSNSHFFEVSNGRNPDIFHPFDETTRSQVRAELGIAPDAPLIVYIGSIGAKYDTPAIARLALALHTLRSDTQLLIMSGTPEKAADELGLSNNMVLASLTKVIRVAPEIAPRYLATADVGTFFCRQSFSTQAVVPIKVGEYLLCGVPVVGTADVGHNAAAVAEGIYFNEATEMERAAKWIVECVLPNRAEMRVRARQSGLAHHSLDRSVSDYKTALMQTVLKNK